MINKDYKSGKIIEIIREWDNTGNKYEINGIDKTLAVPFFRYEFEKFKVIPKGSYRFISENNNEYMEITNPDILANATQFQLVYIYSQESSKYIEDFPDISILKEKYNQLVEDTTNIFGYLKSVGLIADTEQMTQVLTQLRPLETWYMNAEGEIDSLPVSEFSEKLKEVIQKIYEDILSKITTDYEELSKKLATQTQEELAILQAKFETLEGLLDTFTKLKLTEISEFTQKKIEEIQKVCDELIAITTHKLDKVDTIEQLKQATWVKLGDVVEVLGYYSKDDGATHKRVIASEDDGSGVKLDNGLWANILHNGEVNVSWFGAKGDGVADDTLALQKCINTSAKKINLDKQLHLKSSYDDEVIIKDLTEGRGHLHIDGMGNEISIEVVKEYTQLFKFDYNLDSVILENCTINQNGNRYIKIDPSKLIKPMIIICDLGGPYTDVFIKNNIFKECIGVWVMTPYNRNFVAEYNEILYSDVKTTYDRTCIYASSTYNIIKNNIVRYDRKGDYSFSGLITFVEHHDYQVYNEVSNNDVEGALNAVIFGGNLSPYNSTKNVKCLVRDNIFKYGECGILVCGLSFDTENNEGLSLISERNTFIGYKSFFNINGYSKEKELYINKIESNNDYISARDDGGYGFFMLLDPYIQGQIATIKNVVVKNFKGEGFFNSMIGKRNGSLAKSGIFNINIRFSHCDLSKIRTCFKKFSPVIPDNINVNLEIENSKIGLNNIEHPSYLFNMNNSKCKIKNCYATDSEYLITEFAKTTSEIEIVLDYILKDSFDYLIKYSDGEYQKHGLYQIINTTYGTWKISPNSEPHYIYNNSYLPDGAYPKFSKVMIDGAEIVLPYTSAMARKTYKDLPFKKGDYFTDGGQVFYCTADKDTADTTDSHYLCPLIDKKVKASLYRSAMKENDVYDDYKNYCNDVENYSKTKRQQTNPKAKLLRMSAIPLEEPKPSEKLQEFIDKFL